VREERVRGERRGEWERERRGRGTREWEREEGGKWERDKKIPNTYCMWLDRSRRFSRYANESFYHPMVICQKERGETERRERGGREEREERERGKRRLNTFYFFRSEQVERVRLFGNFVIIRLPKQRRLAMMSEA
jgi:hypothetical protein